MKHYFLSFLLFTWASTLSAQKIQWSNVREQNSQKQPIANAQVIFDGAMPTSSDQSGKLRLVFEGKKAGDWTFLTDVQKAGYELVNNKEIEQVKLSSDDQFGVDIILAKSGVVDAAKKQYYDISDRSLTAGFEREKAKLRKALQAAQLNAQQYGEQTQQLQKAYEDQKKELDQLAEKFARVNFDDVTPIYKEALQLFKDGKIAEAIAKLEGTNPAQRTAQIIREQKRIETAQVELDSQKVALAREKTQQIAALRLLADMYSLSFNPEKAEGQYDELLRLDSTDLNILLYSADFYRQNHRYDKALRILPSIIAHPEAKHWEKGIAYEGMGEIYAAVGNLPDALNAYTQFYKTYEKLVTEKPSNINYKENLVASYEKLGTIYFHLGNLNYALFFYEKTNRAFKELHEAYPKSAELKNGLAISYQSMGYVHTSLGNFEKALTFFEKFNQLEKELHEAYPKNVELKNNLANSYSKLGETRIGLGNLDKALTFFEQSNQLFEELHEAYPQNVELKNNLAVSNEKLGSTYTSLGNLGKALTFFEQSNQLLEELYEAYPQNVELKNNLASSHSKLGETYIGLGNLDKALTFIEKSNQLEKDLYEAFPQNVKFKNWLGFSYAELGETHIRLGNLDKALTFIEKSNQLGKELYEAFPQNVKFKNGLAISYSQLGRFFRDKKGDPQKAKEYFQQCFTLLKELSEAYPDYAEFRKNFEWAKEALED